MKIGRVALVLTAVLLVAGCALTADNWPDRAGRTPEAMLIDVVRWQQFLHVKASTGSLHYECFNWAELHAFFESREHTRLAQSLKGAPDFREIVRAMGTLPPDRLRGALLAASSVARPTWAAMGYIDREGKGQTEAGHIADLIVAGAIADAFAGVLGVESPILRDNWRIPGPSAWPEK